MILDSTKLKEIKLDDEIIIADAISNVFKNVDISETGLSTVGLSTDHIYADANITIGNAKVLSNSYGCLAIGRNIGGAEISGTGNMVIGQAKCYSPKNSIAIGGKSTIARNEYSYAIGGQSYGYNSTALAGGITGRENGDPTERYCGETTTAHGVDAHALGQYSHAEGRTTYTYAGTSHTEGFANRTYGLYSHAEGNNCKTGNMNLQFEAASDFSTNRDIIDGFAAHAEGLNTNAYGKGSHTEGQNTKAMGLASHSEGDMTYAYGKCSHTEGQMNIADGDFSHAEGFRTIAASQYSHADGLYSTTRKAASFKTGYLNCVSGDILQWTDDGWLWCADYTHADEEPYKSDISAGAYEYGQLNAMTNSDQEMNRLTPQNIPVVGKYYQIGYKYPSVTVRWKIKTAEGDACRYSYVWNGDLAWSTTINGNNGGRLYPAHGEGTYNINPKDGINGFYIGDNNFIKCIVEAISQIANSSDESIKQELKKNLNNVLA